MKRIKSLATSVAMVCFTILLGCSGLGINDQNQGKNSANSAEKRVEIELPSGKKAVVVDNPNKKEVYNEVAVKNIDQYEGIRGMDFYNEEQLLVIKENKDLPPIPAELDKVYPKNLYLFHTPSKKERLLFSKPINHANAQYSPDRKHIYYVQNSEEVGTAYISDEQGQNSIQVSDRGKIHVHSGYWLNDKEVLYYTFFGQIYRADVNGNRTLLAKTGKTNISNVALIDNKVYYTTVDGDLIVYNLNTKNKTKLKSNVMWLIPSPDQKRFAMVVRTSETRMNLILTDLKGKQTAKLAEGFEIVGTSWSPDQSKLAYTVISNGREQEGLFVADMRSLKSTQISADMTQLYHLIKWNKSSDKMLACFSEDKKDEVIFVTYVITLK